MKEIDLTAPLIFFLCGIVLFAKACLHYKCKLSVRWRSGYFLAPKDEQKAPDFKANSRLLAFTHFLGGIAAVLFGLYEMYRLDWMRLAAAITGIVVMVSAFAGGSVIGKRAKRREKRPGTRKRQSRQAETIREDFSITEIRKDILRFPIMMGCYVLLPLLVIAVILPFAVGEPFWNFFEPVSLLSFSLFSVILGPGCWVLDKLLPKMTLSYHDGIFKIEKNGKTETFPATAIDKVDMESPVMPDYINFHLNDRRSPVKVSMKGFGKDDRFDIPRKIVRITKMPLTRREKQMLDDFDE